MADFATMLARLLGQQEEEINLSSAAPNPQANTRGIFGRRPAGMPAVGYADVAPMRPDWAPQPNMATALAEQSESPHPFPFPIGTPEPPQVQRAPMPQAVRVRVPEPDSPGAYANFADYANAQLGLRTPPPTFDQEPWRQPVSTATWEVGRPSTGRGMEPASAPQRRQPAPFSMEDEAWQAALARARASVEEDRRGAGRRIPRPGAPLIAQAWSDPDRRNRRGGR